MDDRHRFIFVVIALAFITQFVPSLTKHQLVQERRDADVQSASVRPTLMTEPVKESGRGQSPEEKALNSLIARQQHQNGLQRLGLGDDPFGLREKYKNRNNPAQPAQLEQLKKLMESLQQNSDPFEKMLKPVDYRESSTYGIRRDPINMDLLKQHSGTDFAAPANSPVPCPVEGKVVAAGPLAGYGTRVEIQHSERISSFYAHLSKALVKEGDRVTKGQVIGLLGRSGKTTGNNLHYELRVNGKPVNPQALVMLLAMLSNNDESENLSGGFQ
jgi:murein DD-endopeptidase MepM/ murein hydrolase activator NlpD